MVKPFVSNAPFLYPMKTSENHTVFWCFQRVEKGCIGNKLIKWFTKWDWCQETECRCNHRKFAIGKRKLVLNSRFFNSLQEPSSHIPTYELSPDLSRTRKKVNFYKFKLEHFFTKDVFDIFFFNKLWEEIFKSSKKHKQKLPP